MRLRDRLQAPSYLSSFFPSCMSLEKQRSEESVSLSILHESSTWMQQPAFLKVVLLRRTATSEALELGLLESSGSIAAAADGFRCCSCDGGLGHVACFGGPWLQDGGWHRNMLIKARMRSTCDLNWHADFQSGQRLRLHPLLLSEGPWISSHIRSRARRCQVAQPEPLAFRISETCQHDRSQVHAYAYSYKHTKNANKQAVFDLEALCSVLCSRARNAREMITSTIGLRRLRSGDS